MNQMPSVPPVWVCSYCGKPATILRLERRTFTARPKCHPWAEILPVREPEREEG